MCRYIYYLYTMRTIHLDVKIRFTEKMVSDEDLQAIVNNVLDALVRQTNEVGLVPDGSDALTKSITVDEKYSTATAKHIFIAEKTED